MSPVFAHGQLRLYLLAALDAGPRHGYELIQQLEERFHGLYTPSPGTIYPRLAKLEDEGLVRRSDEGRKAVYEITDAGRAELARRGADVEGLESSVDDSVRRLADEVRSRVSTDAADLRAELRAAARDARRTAQPVGPWEQHGAGAGAGPPWSPGDAPATTWGSASGSWSSAPGHFAGGRDERREASSAARDWSSFIESGDVSDLEAIVRSVRTDLRQVWGRRGISPAQAQQIGEVVRQAGARIAEILDDRPSSAAPPPPLDRNT